MGRGRREHHCSSNTYMSLTTTYLTVMQRERKAGAVRGKETVFYLNRLKGFTGGCIPDLFDASVLQSVMPFGLICVFRNVHSGQGKL